MTITEFAVPIIVLLLCPPLLFFWLRTSYALIVNQDGTVRDATRVAELIRLSYPGVLEALESGADLSMQPAFENLLEDFELTRTLACSTRATRPLEYRVATCGFILAKALFVFVDHVVPAETLQRRTLATMAVSVRCIAGLAGGNGS